MHNLGLADEFLDTISRAWTMQEKKLIKVEFTKIKKFCSAKDTASKWEDKTKTEKKKFANHMPGKGLVSRIYIKFLKLKN